MEIQGTLEKKVARPFGLTAWQPRDVTLEEDALVVRNAKRPADTKRYPFAFVALESSVAAPGARLWLLQPSAGGEAALRREMAACGVAAASRLHFAPVLPDVAVHLRRIGRFELVLDTSE